MVEEKNYKNINLIGIITYILSLKCNAICVLLYNNNDNLFISTTQRIHSLQEHVRMNKYSANPPLN